MKKSRRKRMVLLVSCVVFFLSCCEIYGIFVEYKKGNKAYEQIRDMIKNEIPSWTHKSNSTETKEENEALQQREDLKGIEKIPLSDYEIAGKIEAKPGCMLLDLVAVRYNLVNFEQLCQINADVVAWITIEGTNVDYPVVQGTDNTYYLRKTITGEYNIAGSIFVDYQVQSPFACENTVIHGHNQRNHAMFHALSYYIDKEYFDEHKYILIYLPNGRCVTYEIYSFYISDSISITYDCQYQEKEYEQYLAYTCDMSWYDTNVTLTNADQIITLSTCTNGVEDRRYVVHGRKIS